MFKVKTPDGLKGIGAIYVKTGVGAIAEVVSGYQVQSAGGVKTLRPIYTSAVGVPDIGDISCTHLGDYEWEIITYATPAYSSDVLEYRLVGYDRNGKQVDMYKCGEWQTDSRIIFSENTYNCAKTIYVEVRSRRGDKYSDVFRSDETGAHGGHPDYSMEPAGNGEHDAICVRCGAALFRDSCSEAYRENAEGGSHEIYCKSCGQTLDGTESCTYGDDGTCIHCGGSK